MLWIHLQTLFSFRAYHKLIFATRWQLIGFAVYLWMLSLLVFYGYASGFVKKNLPVFLKNFPQVTFEKGVLTAPDKTVYAYLPGSDLKIAFESARQTPPTLSEFARQNISMWVSKNTLYMPGIGGVQAHPIPPALSATTTPQFLAKHQPVLAASLTATALFAALFFIPLVFAFNICLAAGVGFLFRALTFKWVPGGIIWRWALFLQGPLAVLWYVRLWYDIPLFMLAQTILCIIYVQQIFNLIPEGKNAY